MSQFLDRVKFGNAHNGIPAVTGTINSYATCTGTLGATTLTTTLSASLGNVIFIHQTKGAGAGQNEINYVISDNGATLTVAYPLTYAYGTGAQCVLVPQYTGGTLSGTVTGIAWGGSVGGIVALMASGELTVSGTITASGLGFRGGSGVGPGNAIDGKQGESYAGTWNTTSYLANYSAGGGGENLTNQAANGGGGGNGVSGLDGTPNTNGRQGKGGATSGNEELTSVFLGGGGGSASTGNDGSSYSTNAGNGGGIIMIFAPKITVSGSVIANGGNGPDLTYQSGSGGAGAGGSIIFFSQTPILGTNLVTAIGGAGGNSGTGGNGGNGRIRINYYSGVSGTTNPTLSSGQNTSLQSFIYGGLI